MLKLKSKRLPCFAYFAGCSGEQGFKKKLEWQGYVELIATHKLTHLIGGDCTLTVTHLAISGTYRESLKRYNIHIQYKRTLC